jgi:malonyl CoA-acyl carrier protein transacylase
MQECVDRIRNSQVERERNRTFGMLAVFPLSFQDASRAVTEAHKQLGKSPAVVSVANQNSLKQIVFSGDMVAVELAASIAKASYGAKKSIPLDVSAPFHSPIVAPAAQAVTKFFRRCPVIQPWIPLISNYNALPVRDPPLPSFVMDGIRCDGRTRDDAGQGPRASCDSIRPRHAFTRSVGR